MSLFISFEGGEGTGKSTQAELLADRLRDAGYQVLFLHEPGTTRLGQYLRDWVKRESSRTDAISSEAELFMFAAARAELVSKVIKPTIARHPRIAIVADRYADSTTAYQGYGRRLPLAQVEVVNQLATQGLMPDLTFLMDASPEVGRQRSQDAQFRLPMDGVEVQADLRIDPEGTRRFEEETLDFLERVRHGYLETAKYEPDRIKVVDATKPLEVISQTVWETVQASLEERKQRDAAGEDGEAPLFRLDAEESEQAR